MTEELKHTTSISASTEITVICAWCNKHLSGPPLVVPGSITISHGICKECGEKFLKEKS